MSDFILEIYGEEIPSSAQSLIENQFERCCKIVLGLQWVFERGSDLKEVTVVFGD